MARILSTRDLHKTLRCITNNLCCQIFSLLRWITKLLKIQLNKLLTSIKKKRIKWRRMKRKIMIHEKKCRDLLLLHSFYACSTKRSSMLIWSLSIVIVKIWWKSECQAERCRKNVNGRIKLRIVFIRRGCKNRRSDSNPSIDFASKNWNNDSNNRMQRERWISREMYVSDNNYNYFIINGSETVFYRMSNGISFSK